MAIGRLFKSIWYMLTGRAHELSDKIMENPEAVRGAYEDIIKDKKETIQRYKGAVGQLMALLKQKQVSVQELTQEVTRLEDLKKGALAKAKQSAVKTHCASNMKQWGIGTMMYGGDNDDYFPDNTRGQHTSWVSKEVDDFWKKYIMPQKFDSKKKKEGPRACDFLPFG